MAKPLSDDDPVTARHMVEAATAPLLLDVRENDEWVAGHAPEAVHVPLGDLDPSAYTDKTLLVVVCRSGGRSSKAAAGLPAQSLSGGMTAWQRAGHPVIRDDYTPGAVVQ